MLKSIRFIIIICSIFLIGCLGSENDTDINQETESSIKESNSILSGKVIDPTTNEGAADVTVYARKVENELVTPDVELITVTDEKGEFSFEDVPLGEWRVVAEKSEELKVISDIIVIDKYPFYYHFGYLLLQRVGKISGQAVLDGETDHLGIDVFIPGTSFVAKTDSEGNFLISYVPAGTYDIYVSYTGFEITFIADITVTTAHTTDIEDLLTLYPLDPETMPHIVYYDVNGDFVGEYFSRGVLVHRDARLYNSAIFYNPNLDLYIPIYDIERGKLDRPDILGFSTTDCTGASYLPKNSLVTNVPRNFAFEGYQEGLEPNRFGVFKTIDETATVIRSYKNSSCNPVDFTPISNFSLPLSIDSIDLVVDSQNMFHAVYDGQATFYVTNKNGVIEEKYLGPTTGGDSTVSIAIDASDFIHIAYSNTLDNNLYYITNKSGEWLTEIVDSPNFLRGNSIAIDQDGFVHIVYSVYGDYGNSHLKYASNVSDHFVTEELDQATNITDYIAIGVDQMNVVHVVYQNYPDHNLKYISNYGGSFPSMGEIIDNESIYYSVSLATGFDEAYISYFDYENKYLKYAYGRTGNWNTCIIDQDVEVDSGAKISNRFGLFNDNHIAYKENNNLKHAYGHNCDWSIEILKDDYYVDPMSHVDISAAIDFNENIHVIYEISSPFPGSLVYSNNISGVLDSDVPWNLFNVIETDEVKMTYPGPYTVVEE